VKPAELDVLRCPVCGRAFAFVGGRTGKLICECGRVYDVVEGIPHLVHPTTLLPSDAEFQLKYDVGAADYDSGLAWLFEAFRVDEDKVRDALVDLLELRAGARVLETGCGTGKDSARILGRIGQTGTLYAQDLSIGMLGVARRKLKAADATVEYVLSNASYLPFADGAFDAAFHFGGVNTFSERRRALCEMARVVRPGGKVVVGDEGIAPWLRRRVFGRILVRANPLYAHRPPVAELPQNAAEVRLQWIIGNAFYVIDYRVADGPPSVDVDLPIPGKRDTLRSRYCGGAR
jgi:SAM-dependent methyltransferase